MATVSIEDPVSPEQLLKMPEGDRYELVQGQLLERNRSGLSTYIAAIVIRELGNFVAEHNLGIVFGSEAQYRCFPDDPRKVRKPDVSFVAIERFSEEILHGLIAIAPDLAVEVISDHDTYYDVDRKIHDFMAAGVRLVWVLNPTNRTVRVIRPDRQQLLDAADTLSGEEVVAGFSVAVGSLFELPTRRESK